MALRVVRSLTHKVQSFALDLVTVARYVLILVYSLLMCRIDTLPSVSYDRLFFCVCSGHLHSLLRSNWVLRGYRYTHIFNI